jgi:hypothetical protein
MNALASIQSARPFEAPSAPELLPPFPVKGFALRVSSWHALRHIIRIATWGNFAAEFFEFVKLAIDVTADLLEWADGLTP